MLKRLLNRELIFKKFFFLTMLKTSLNKKEYQKLSSAFINQVADEGNLNSIFVIGQDKCNYLFSGSGRFNFFRILNNNNFFKTFKISFVRFLINKC